MKTKASTRTLALAAMLAMTCSILFASCAGHHYREDRRDGRQDHRDDRQEGRQDHRDHRQDARQSRW